MENIAATKSVLSRLDVPTNVTDVNDVMLALAELVQNPEPPRRFLYE